MPNTVVAQFLSKTEKTEINPIRNYIHVNNVEQMILVHSLTQCFFSFAQHAQAVSRCRRKTDSCIPNHTP